MLNATEAMEYFVLFSFNMHDITKYTVYNLLWKKD